jgi:hypothetical protein
MQLQKYNQISRPKIFHPVFSMSPWAQCKQPGIQQPSLGGPGSGEDLQGTVRGRLGTVLPDCWWRCHQKFISQHEQSSDSERCQEQHGSREDKDIFTSAKREHGEEHTSVSFTTTFMILMIRDNPANPMTLIFQERQGALVEWGQGVCTWGVFYLDHLLAVQPWSGSYTWVSSTRSWGKKY